MILLIIFIGIIVFLCGWVFVAEKVSDQLAIERNQVSAQLRNLDREYREYRNEKNALTCKYNKLQEDDRKEVVRLTNKIIEINKHAELVENDAAQRIEEFKKHPIIACMSEGQVQILAEMLSYHLREILEDKKEWVNYWQRHRHLHQYQRHLRLQLLSV